jgi:predicted  nucleic acid-binding Zn-ribbon protein
MGDSDTLQKQLDEKRGGFDDLKARHDAAYSEWQSSLGDLRKQAETLKNKAAMIESGIPERLRAEFHKVFKQRQGIAVARVISDTCSGCRSRVRPALYQQLKRGELVRCESCSRILYLEKNAS